MRARSDFCEQVRENSSLITVMNLSGDIVKPWHLSGLWKKEKTKKKLILGSSSMAIHHQLNNTMC